MPERNGYKATAQMRNKESETGASSGVSSASIADTSIEDNKRCAATGMDDFLSQSSSSNSTHDTFNHRAFTEQMPHEVFYEESLNDDLDAMQAVFGKDFSELANLFQTDSIKRIAAMYAAAQIDDKKDLARLVHSLSGSASSMGAMGLALLCKKLEAQIKSGLTDCLELKIQAIEVDFLKVDARLCEMLKIS